MRISDWSSDVCSSDLLSRYYGNTHSPEITKVIADDVLRVSGLNKLTEAGQRAFGLDFLGTLGDHREEAFGELKPNLREAFGRYGIDAGDWDKIRAAAPERSGSAEWVRTPTIADQEENGRTAWRERGCED